MSARSCIKGLLSAAIAVSGLTVAGAARPVPGAIAAVQAPSATMMELLDYVRGQNTTGFLVIQGEKVLIEQNWPAPAGERAFANFAYERTGDGALLEDVASQQKSFVSVLVAVAIDKGLIDVDKPVSAYIGSGWSRATSEQEAKIRVIDVLTMSSGLDGTFNYAIPAGTRFQYNTQVYAITKRIVAAAAHEPLEAVTRDWLTAPVGMTETTWRKRPAALAGVGNDTGLVTSPRDIAKFGLMILHGGVADSGKRVVSQKSLAAIFARSATNPAYGRLWWLNGSAYTVGARAERREGPLLPAAPADMVAALGAFDRQLYIVPSRQLVVVRTGAAAPDKDFREQLWIRLMKVVD